MSENFEKIMLQEFKKVNDRLDKIDTKISKLEERTDRIENKMDKLEEKMDGLENRMDKLEERMDRIENKMDISNSNIINILERQNYLSEQMKTEHKELINKIEDYEKGNELEHSRLNYEICKLKARA